ncbi:HAD family hydrolase [Vitiosangium sp. GDMCC 1.1324]|uniref:HAD family hydrolase n=1 Tax=Vitiosangium sp. (strain GDMCC 1.1324) TaxID=2138576 RepID=UPI000D3A589A|nr:HAD hydrolase-like protein [Vitiosangium sp. GDMCC 1.1324]PTL84522.1 HAD family hydrolase [Vitiosangium sp. GDMCC 1.1324]
MRELWSQVRHVVLDWNGTLLDDVELAVKGVNHACTRFQVPAVTREHYRARFRFPISDFYASLGFDLSQVPFAEVIREYLSFFDARVRYCDLNDGAVDFLDCLRQNGIGLSILSASYRPTLIETIEAKGLSGYFTHVCGLGDERATSKLAEGRVLNEKLGLAGHQILYLGDTTHDVEIAEALGWNSCILSCGHQDETLLASCTSPKVPGIRALLGSLPWQPVVRNGVRVPVGDNTLQR